MSSHDESEKFDENQIESDELKSDEQSEKIENNNENNDSLEEEKQEINIEYINEQYYSNINSQKEEQEQILQQQNRLIQAQENLDQIVEIQFINKQNQCPLYQYGQNVGKDELEKHQACSELLTCQFCGTLLTFCSYQSHLYQEHEEFVCFNCGLVDQNITNQNHRLRCFQITQFGFDDARISQLDSFEQPIQSPLQQHLD